MQRIIAHLATFAKRCFFADLHATHGIALQRMATNCNEYATNRISSHITKNDAWNLAQDLFYVLWAILFLSSSPAINNCDNTCTARLIVFKYESKVYFVPLSICKQVYCISHFENRSDFFGFNVVHDCVISFLLVEVQWTFLNCLWCLKFVPKISYLASYWLLHLRLPFEQLTLQLLHLPY